MLAVVLASIAAVVRRLRVDGGAVGHSGAGAAPMLGSTVGRIQMSLMNRVRQFVRGEEGQDLIEYALLVGLISLVAVAAITTSGTSVNDIFTAISGQLAAAAGAGA